MNDDTEKGRPGQFFEEFLKEQGNYEETTEQAVKRVLAYQLAEAMKQQGISKVEMARRLSTSRSQLDRLLDPKNEHVTLNVLSPGRTSGRTFFEAGITINTQIGLVFKSTSPCFKSL